MMKIQPKISAREIIVNNNNEIRFAQIRIA